MKSEQVHTLILGAGPSGLAAGYVLARAGHKPVVVERDKVCGGLMRSLKRGDFVLDIGRKELYNRLAKVDTFWTELLGQDYRSYPHRGGILYEGKIIEMSPSYRGFRRGLSWGMFLSCSLGFFRARAFKPSTPPRTLQDYFYQKRGRRMTQVFSQGFQEKLNGKKWSEVELPQVPSENGDASFMSTMKALLVRTFSQKEVNTYKGIWRHPAKGTGQICDSMAAGIVKHGGVIQYESQIRGMTVKDNQITAAEVQVGNDVIEYRPRYVVSSIPVEFLVRYLLPDRADLVPEVTNSQARPKRTVILVYLFLNEEPRFPHAWLQVTCPQTRIGRIANYAAFSGDMVPKGKTCICCEYYCFGQDSLLESTNEELAKMTLEYCGKHGLLDASKCFDQLVLRLPGADASQNRDNWMSKSRLQRLDALKHLANLYYVNRTETDIATLAGIEAGEAIVSGNRTEFDLHLDPAQLNIRSESKAFEFKNPVSEAAPSTK